MKKNSAKPASPNFFSAAAASRKVFRRWRRLRALDLAVDLGGGRRLWRRDAGSIISRKKRRVSEAKKCKCFVFFQLTNSCNFYNHCFVATIIQYNLCWRPLPVKNWRIL